MLLALLQFESHIRGSLIRVNLTELSFQYPSPLFIWETRTRGLNESCIPGVSSC